MARYKVLLSKKAQKSLDKLPDAVADHLFDEILLLENEPRPFGYKKLKGRDAFRIRVGNYRIIYEIFETELLIDIIDLGHRKDIYQ